jgi:hypothetical protein
VFAGGLEIDGRAGDAAAVPAITSTVQFVALVPSANTFATTRSMRGFVGFDVPMSRSVAVVNVTVKHPPVALVDCTTHVPALTFTFIAGVPNGATSNGVPPDGTIPERATAGVLPVFANVALDPMPNRCA